MPFNLISMLKKDRSSYIINSYKTIVKKINNMDLSLCTDEEIKIKSMELMEAVNDETSLDEMLPEAFALVKETVKRTMRINTHDEQLIAGIGMHFGKLVEMQTGEGKTLSAVFPAYLNALAKKGVHVLTFNDYLAKRDAQWMGPIYEFLGLSVGYIQGNMDKQDREIAYRADILYITAKEAGFDYLRNFLCFDKTQLMPLAFNYAIVDEADSILIDEARIPLVIAVDKDKGNSNLQIALEAIRKLEPEKDYEIDDYAGKVYFTYEGIDTLENILNCENLYDEKNSILLCELNNALQAEVLYEKDIDYVIKNGKVELVDEFTGRVAENRHWPDGLQSAVEVKEGLQVQNQGRIMNQITIENFISLYEKLAGMTGTAATSADEFKDIYDLEVVVIPPHKPCIRKDLPDEVFTHKEAKYRALVQEVCSIHKTGQPVLIGTSSVKESMRISSELRKSGVSCSVLNAKDDSLEAQIIEQAGAFGVVTVSTNMAGRGTDIKLGGSKEKDRETVINLGGLYIIGTNRHESIRIDNQLRGRAGRQGDPGISKFFISLEDELINKCGIEELIPETLRPERQIEPIDNPIIRKKIEQVQRRIQGKNSDLRVSLRKYSLILEKQRRVINSRRMEILLDTVPFDILEKKVPELYLNLISILGEENTNYLISHVTLYYINTYWSEYLKHVDEIRESIQLAIMGGKNPLEEFQSRVINAVMELEYRIEEAVFNDFKNLEISEKGIMSLIDRVKPPSATWTYFINDTSFVDNLGQALMGNAGVVAAGAPALLGLIVFSKLYKKKK